MNPATATRNNLTYPAELVDCDGWKPSTITTPIALLEFDLRGRAFVRGFRRALTEMLGVEVDIGIQRSGGHLFTLVSPRNELGSIRRTDGFPSIEDFRQQWCRRTQPATLQVLEWLDEACGQSLTQQISKLRLIEAWLEELIYQHHILLLPARAALVEFADFAVDQDLLSTHLEALSLLAGEPNATTFAAQQLWDARHLACRRPAPSDSVIAMVAKVPQEGEGYGLQHPSWLDDASVPLAIAECFATDDSDTGPYDGLNNTTAKARALEAQVHHGLSRRSRRVQQRFTALKQRAASALAVTEDHAPLMHGRLSHQLRRFTMSLGAGLVQLGRLGSPGDVVHLHVDELIADSAQLHDLIESRRAEPYVEPPLQLAGKPAAVPGVDPALGSSRLASYVQQVFGGARATVMDSSGALRGEPAASGQVTGRARRLRRHLGLSEVRSGEIVIASSNSAIWSFALPVAAAVVAPGGSRVGHLASLARDYSRPCVVGLDHRLDDVRDGDLIEVDGDNGIVRIKPVKGGADVRHHS